MNKFSLREFVKKGLIDAIGKMGDYQIILNAMGWFEKGVLLEEDLVEINQAIEESHIIQEVVEEVEEVEESNEEEPQYSIENIDE